MISKPQRDDWLAAARLSPVLAAAGESSLAELQGAVLCHTYPKNNILFYQGEPARSVYLVVSGEVKVGLTNEEAKEVVIRLVRAGGLVGLAAVVDGGVEPATAITVTRARLARFGGPELVRWVEAHPAAQAALLRELATRVREGYQKIGEHALLTVKERLLSALLEIAEREGEPNPGGDGIVFTRPTHQELADRIGSSREVVSRVLKELLEGDLLEAEGRIIRVSESALVLRDD
ncbi:MAG: Crp/Fnr family transcriptional regulator [Gemmatimonadota bacterium]